MRVWPDSAKEKTRSLGGEENTVTLYCNIGKHVVSEKKKKIDVEYMCGNGTWRLVSTMNHVVRTAISILNAQIITHARTTREKRFITTTQCTRSYSKKKE